MTVHVLVITGSMGSGNTTVLGEASDLLSAAGIPHGIIDLDAIGAVGRADDVVADLECRQLAAIYSNSVGAEITRVLLAEAIESRTELERIARAMPGAQLLLCRLAASIETMQARMTVREHGILQQQFITRVHELDHVSKQAALEAFTVANEGH